MLMIWSSLARNRSPSPVASCFFGRIVSSDAAIEITACRPRESQKRNRKVLRPSSRQTLQSKTGYCAENRFAFNRLAVVHGRLVRHDVDMRLSPALEITQLEAAIRGAIVPISR